MYKVDTPTNSLHSLQEVSFSSLGFTERYHLQEWLAKNPQALTRDNDDELLIIQKEFAGFDDTNMPVTAPICAKNRSSTSSSSISTNTSRKRPVRRLK